MDSQALCPDKEETSFQGLEGEMARKLRLGPHIPCDMGAGLQQGGQKHGEHGECCGVAEKAMCAKPKDNLGGAPQNTQENTSADLALLRPWLKQNRDLCVRPALPSRGSCGLESRACTFVTTLWFPEALTCIICPGAHITPVR